MFFTDIPNNRIHKIGLDGKVGVFKQDTGGANGLMFGPDGRLYACQDGRKRIVAYSMDGKETVIAEDVNSNDLVTARGEIYFTDPLHKRVWFIDGQGGKRVVHEGIQFPNGVRPFAGPGVFDRRRFGQPLGMVVPGAAGRLAGMAIRSTGWRRPTNRRTGADGMAWDTDGFLYVTTRMGIQVFDPPGRVMAILSKPQPRRSRTSSLADPTATRCTRPRATRCSAAS